MTITLVGDLNQMMFRFTGASPELLTQHIDEEIPDIQTMFLDVNYRSTQQIISTCSQLIAHNYAEQGGRYSEGFAKQTQPRPNAPEGEPVTFQMFETNIHEAKSVAETIIEQQEQGYKFGDFFVGSRTRAQLAYLEGELFRNQIKFVNLAGGSFWQNYHIANIIAFLKLAINSNDEVAFKKVYNIASADHTDKKGNYCHHHWMGAEFVRITGSNYNNMDDAVRHNKRYYYGVQDLRTFMADVKAEIHNTTPGDVIRFIMDNCYSAWLKAKGDTVDAEADSSIQDDVMTVVDVAADYDTVEEFLNYVQKMEDAAEAAKNGDMDEYVVLSTYHRLKGKERKIMIGIGWCEGDDGTPAAQPRGLLPHTFSLTPPPQNGVLPTNAAISPIEDERCIAFVCISRAKDKVFLTGSANYRNYKLHPSRFIAEAGIEVIVLEDEIVN